MSLKFYASIENSNRSTNLFRPPFFLNLKNQLIEYQHIKMKIMLNFLLFF